MDERVRSLLDFAVADVRPQARHPALQIMRRARVQRRRRAVAGAAGMVALTLVAAAGGTVADGRFGGLDRRGVAVASGGSGRTVPGSTPTPRVVDGVVQVGGLDVPVPAGWRVVEGRHLRYCDVGPHTVLVGGVANPSPAGPCHSSPTVQVDLSYPAHIQPIGRNPVAHVDELIHATGQPVWRQASGNFVIVTFPWSGARLVFSNTAGKDVSRILASVRWQPSRLRALPLYLDARSARLSTAGGGSFNHTTRTGRPDKTIVALEMRLLTRLTRVVADKDACDLGDRPARLVLQGPHGTTEITFGTTRNCSQALVSSSGSTPSSSRVRVRFQTAAGIVSDLPGLLAGSGAAR
jgi:hypothetical protein